MTTFAFAVPFAWLSGAPFPLAAHSEATPVHSASAVSGAVPPRVDTGEDVLTNGDVLRLRRAGVGARVLVRLIGSRRVRFHLGASDLLDLKESGVEDEVIDAMMTSQDLNLRPITH